MITDRIKKQLTYFFVFLVLILVVIQLKRFYFREKLVLKNFENNDKIVVNKEVYRLKGETSDIKKLFVNNKEYFLDEDDNFDIELNLFKGFNNFYIKAITESGKTIEKNITIFSTGFQQAKPVLF